MLSLRITLRNRGRQILTVLFLFLMMLPAALAQPSGQTDDASLFRDGEVYLAAGDVEKALWRFKSLITDFPNSHLVNESKFRMGICYTRLQRPKDATRTLTELSSTFMSPSRMIQVFTLLGDNYVELKDLPNAVLWYGKGLLVPGQPNEELKKKVKSLLDVSASEEDLKNIESLYRGSYAGGYAKLKRAGLAKQQGNDPLARTLLSDLEKEYRGMDYLLEARELLKKLPPPVKQKSVIGVILPLSGDQRSFGERALQGIQCAIKEGEDPLISLAIRDSKGSPEEAGKAVEELANQEGIIAIIGPLLSIEVDSAVQKAQQFQVPLLTLSQKELPPGKLDFIFQNTLSPADQIQILADFTTKQLNLKTFAVLYPDSLYGLFCKNLFNQEMTLKGGIILGNIAYPEGQSDFSREIKELFKIKIVKKQGAKKNKKEDAFESGISIDGLFIPDDRDRAGTILSFLPYYDISGLTPFGINTWNGNELISIGGKGSEGAIFTDAFFKNSPSPLIAHFVEEFQKLYSRDPETLEAMSYDGAKLLKELLQSKPISSPSQLQEALRQVTTFQGVSGLKGFNQNGKAIRTLTILKVHHGQIEQISPK